MNIEVKNVKIAAHLSQETTAFTASLYIDGKRVGTAQNQGTGSCTLVTPRSTDDRDIIAAAERHFKARTVTLGLKPSVPVQDSLGFKIERLVERFRYERDVKRLVRNKTVFTHNGAVYTSPASTAAIKARHPDAKVLNDLSFDEAVDLFVETIKSQAHAA